MDYKHFLCVKLAPGNFKFRNHWRELVRAIKDESEEKKGKIRTCEKTRFSYRLKPWIKLKT